MDPIYTELKLSLVETSYSESTQKWTVNVENCHGQVITNVAVKRPIEDKDENELRWYLEEHALSDPYQIKRAKETMAMLVHYKNELAKYFQEAIRRLISAASILNLQSIRIEVVSQSSTARFQSLHWELLESANWDIGVDVKIIVTRRIIVPGAKSTTPVFVSDTQINILFVSARPGADRDVDYRLISKPLVDLVDTQNIRDRCNIDFVRPGSWFYVENYLQLHPPGYYSIVHFDVHGSLYMNEPYLHFTPVIPELISDDQKASTVAEELKNAAVKVVILNACNSANAMSSHTNLAQIFVEAGITTVIAMSYAVLAESAKIFVGHFYRNFLFQQLDADLATFAARRAMDSPLRRGAFGLIRLVEDSATPVLYKGYSGPLSWQASSLVDPVLPDASLESPSTAPFIGRDIDILKLEDLLSWKHVVYLYGPAASGKTSLARHLEYWWARSRFFDSIHIVSCRTFASFDQSTLYKSLASLISGRQITNAEHIGDQEAREIVHKSSSIIFIDDCETTIGKQGLEHFGLPGLDHEAAHSLQRFLDHFCADEELESRLIIISRTDALMADHILDPNGRITKEHIGYYELQNLRSTDVIQVMKDLGDANSTLQTFGDTELKEVTDLTSFHDNNVTMASFLAAYLNQSELGARSIEKLDQVLQADLPAYLSTMINSRLSNPPDQSVTVFSDFGAVMANLRSAHPDIHRTMLCFALNRNRCINFTSLSGYLLNLAGWELLPGCPGSQTYRLSTPLARRAARRPDRFHTKIFDHSPSTRNALRDAMKILKVLGLIEEDVTLASQDYYKLHPLLPYLLRTETLLLKDSSPFTQTLCNSFLDYWHFRASEWTQAGKNTVPALISTEWPNLCCAIDLCIKHRDFEKGNIEVFDALKHVLKQGGRTTAKVEKCIKLLTKAVSRFSTLATQSSHSALSPFMLTKAMVVVRLMLQFIDLSDVVGAALTSIRQSTDLLAATRRAYGELDSESWCTSIAIDLALLKHGLATDQSHKCALVDSVWNVKPPGDVLDDLSNLIFDTQFHLLFLLLDRKGLMESCSISRDMIQVKADALLTAMAIQGLDSTDLELKWSMFKLKHWSENASVPFDLDGVSQTDGIIHMLQQRGFKIDENDPRFAIPMAIKYKDNPARARSILLNALHPAHNQNNRHEQRLLHKALFMTAVVNRDLEHSIVHFDEMMKLDYAIAAAISSSTTQATLLSIDQLQLEAWGNMVIAEEVIRQHATKYNSQLGNTAPGTSRPPTAASTVSKALALSRLQRSLELAVGNNFKDLQCVIHLNLGSYEAYLEARPNSSWVHFARAVAFGDNVNLRHKERFVFGMDLAHGRFVVMLMTAWQFKTAASARDKISESVAEGLSGKWSSLQVRAFLDLTHSGAKIGGAMLDHSFFQDPPLNRYFEEAQQILFDEHVDIDAFIFWRRRGQDWGFDEEAASEASIHALLAGSRRQNPQNWDGSEPLELPERFRKLEI